MKHLNARGLQIFYAVIFRICVVLAKVSFGTINFPEDLFFVSHGAWELSHLCQRCFACVWVIYFYVCIYLQAVLNGESMSLLRGGIFVAYSGLLSLFACRYIILRAYLYLFVMIKGKFMEKFLQ